MQHYTPKTKPFPHQLKELEEQWKTTGRCIFWEQGTGKTKEAIDTAMALYAAGEIDAAVVLAPSGVDRNWKSDELPSHVPDDYLKKISVHVWRTQSAGTKWHAKAFEDLRLFNGMPWLIMSYDAIMTEAGRQALWKFLRHRRVFYVADESQFIKAPGAKRTKRAVSSAVYAPYRRILTGTPIAKGPFDIYSQVKFVDEDFWKRNGFADYTSFKTHFGIWFRRSECQQLHGYDPGFDKLMGYKNLDELNALLQKVSTRVTKDEVLPGLPPKLYTKRYYDLTPEQVRLYTKLKEDFYVETSDGGIVEAGLPIVRLLRFQQICNGYVGTDSEDEEPIHLIPGGNPLLDSLGEWAEGIHSKTIIWARFSKDIDLITEMLSAKGAEVVRYDGKISDDEAADNSERFKRGTAQYIVGNPAKGSTGLTWNMAHNVAYYSNSFKLLERLQSEDRAHRIGLEHPVNYVDFIANITIGEKVYPTVTQHIVKNLRDKVDIASVINGDKLKEWI